MYKITFVTSLLLMGSCTVNTYDYSSHTSYPGGTGSPPPDTIYIEPGGQPGGSAVIPPPVFPDTVFSRYPLVEGGFVEIEESMNWSRYTLIGCKTETDGVAFEMRPIVVSVTSSEGEITKDFQIEFSCVMQSLLVGSATESIILNDGVAPSGNDGTLLPVVTGTEVVAIVAERTSFPFLAEQAVNYSGNLKPDGTIMYEALFTLPQWMLRDICTAEELVTSSKTPEFRMIFGERERRLLQQFFDIFVIHDGDAPVLPVRGIEIAN